MIVPYVRQPEEEIPGKPLFFATAITQGGVASGLLVESHEGRPTKIEGNPDHPASHGATDLYAQGSILTLYDPDRSQTILQLGEIRPWNAVIAAVRGGLSAQAATKGAGLRIVTETVASPTLAAQIQQILKLHPGAKWIQWEPVNRDNARAGARSAFGQYVEPLYDLTRADVIVSLDADFLASDGAFNLHYMRQFAGRRRVEENADNLSRLYVVESNHTVTGGRADNRLPLKSSQIESFARAVAAASGVAGISGTAPAGSEPFVDAVAKDLAAHRGRAVVIAGDAMPPAVHAIAHAINAALGAPVTYLPTPEIVPSEQHAALRELVAEINASQVQMLLIIGESNPVLSAPADLKFGEAIQSISLTIHSGLFFDETATQCRWHIPAAHFLEAWSDARTIDGTVSLVQPLIQPLYGGKSAHEVIATLSDRPERNGYDLVREYWQQNSGASGASDAWCNGAGLAMATMDIVKLAGGEPANFLDVGGGASPEQIESAFRILSSDPRVEAVFINVFGGILRCDRLAAGLIAAVQKLGVRMPIVVRMEGTNVELGRKMLAESGLNFTSASDMGDGAQKVVALAGGVRL